MVRAMRAGTGLENRSHTCARSPERERSTSTGTSAVRATSRSARVLTPAGPVEVDREQVAALVGQQRFFADRLRPFQVTAELCLAVRDEPAVRACRALDSRLLAQSRLPFVQALGRPPGLVGLLLALPAGGEHVRPSAEQAGEQRHPTLGGGGLPAAELAFEVRDPGAQLGALTV
jgi:hypothetical protein